MSSLTKAQFTTELKARSKAVYNMADADIETFIDVALRAYSNRLPKLMWDVDNSVVVDQALYDFPTGALKVVALRTSDYRQPISFTVEDQGSGNKIRPGNLQEGSLDKYIESVYYVAPGNSGGNTVNLITLNTYQSTLGYDSFDINYVKLQTMSDISDRGLEALSLYVEYLAYNFKASEAAEVAAASDSSQEASSITDTDPTGATTTVSFTTKESASKMYSDLATAKLEAFNAKLAPSPYGRRA